MVGCVHCVSHLEINPIYILGDLVQCDSNPMSSLCFPYMEYVSKQNQHGVLPHPKGPFYATKVARLSPH